MAAAALAAASLLLPVGRAYADENTAARPVASSSAHIDKGEAISFPNAVRRVCSDAKFVLAGDTKHTANIIRETFVDPSFARMLKECGFTKVMVETSVSFQKYFTAYQEGKMSVAEFEAAQKTEHGNIYNMSEADYSRKMTLERLLVDELRKSGIPLLAIDNGKAASQVYRYVFETDLAFDLMRSKLDPEAQKYFDLTQAKKTIDLPKEKIADLDKRLDLAYNDPDVQKIFAEADKYAPALKDRVADEALVKGILEKIRPQDKVFIVYGAGHMNNSAGLYTLLKKQFAVVRFDMAAEAYIYKTEDIKPDFLYRLDLKRLYRVDSAPPTAAPQPSTAPRF